MNILIWLLRLLAAGLLLQTLYFKFTGHPESVQLFSILGMEPWGRIGTGVGELLAALLILYPRTTGWGALMAVGMMSGAIFFHLTKLGIYFGGNAFLFTYAVIVWIASAVLAIIFRHQILRVVSFKAAGN